MEKRGQGLSTNAMVLIILAVVILVILILGFSLGWEKLNPFIGGNNVDTVVNNCLIACTQGSSYGFCVENQILKAEGLPGGVKSVEKTCNELSTGAEYQSYGIAECPNLC
jgi:hypothetical protein